MYAVVERMNPVTIYLHTKYFHVWFASQPYTNDAKTLGTDFNPFIHLTNRGVNIEHNTPEGSNWITKEDKPNLGKSIEMTPAAFIKHCEENYGKGHDNLIEQAMNICAPTMHGMANYKLIRDQNTHLKGKLADRSFELFGIDILVDAECRLWLCEVNRSPGISYPPDKFNNGEPNPHYEASSKMQVNLVHDLMKLLALDSCTKGNVDHWVPLAAPGATREKKLATVG